MSIQPPRIRALISKCLCVCVTHPDIFYCAISDHVQRLPRFFFFIFFFATGRLLLLNYSDRQHCALEYSENKKLAVIFCSVCRLSLSAKVVLIKYFRNEKNKSNPSCLFLGLSPLLRVFVMHRPMCARWHILSTIKRQKLILLAVGSKGFHGQIIFFKPFPTRHILAALVAALRLI